MKRLRQRLKVFLFRLLGKDPEAVVMAFWTGQDSLARAMVEEVWELIPDRRLFVVGIGDVPDMPVADVVRLAPASAWELRRQLRTTFQQFRIGMAPVLFTRDAAHRELRLAAFLLAPRKILAYNARLERHHLRLRSAIASWLFWRGVPLDRIFLRPWWLCPWKRDRSTVPGTHQILDGRPLAIERRRVAVLSPYFPYPLSHGGAVRIYHLLREMAAEFDVFLFAFVEGGDPADYKPVLEFCAKVILVPKPRYREPRWSSLAPPEVCEYRSPVMQRMLRSICAEFGIRLRQVEYTHLAEYGGDALVEHDVTSDLYRQVYERSRSLSRWWDWWRWRRFETRAVRGYRSVVAMSETDRRLIGVPGVRVIANGVDLARFRPGPETEGQRLLFIGSFRHFPNVIAFRFLVEEVWPELRRRFPEMTLTAVAGPNPLTHWQNHTGLLKPPEEKRIRLREFVRDVRPLYVEANLVVVPTLVSAGTNVKVLEAMAMERAVVSTSSGCAGLGLAHGTSVWIADSAAAFAEGVARLAVDGRLRAGIARAARDHAEKHFSWSSLGAAQRALVRELLSPNVQIRRADERDLDGIARIQAISAEAAHWEPRSYFAHEVRVAIVDGRLVGFLVARPTAGREREVLNLAVDPEFRRQGIATSLLRDEMLRHRGDFYLEVRESNLAARGLYRSMGFREAGVRQGYYDHPEETAIVVKFHS